MNFIRNGINLFEKCHNVELAKLHAKIYWGWVCLLDDMPNREIKALNGCLDGCHYYPAGLPRFEHIRCLPANIIPMQRRYHNYWDRMPIGFKKIRLLEESKEYADRLRLQLELVDELAVTA